MGNPAIQPETVIGAKLYANRHQMVADLGLLPDCVIAEIGVAHGEFSDFLIRNLSPSHFYALDLFQMEQVPVHWGIPQEVLFKGKTHYNFYRDRFADLRDRMTIIRGRSVDTISELPDRSLDMIYIDANHAYEHVIREGTLSAQKIKRDGILIFNDYITYDPFIKLEYGVVRAVNEMIATGEWRVLGFALQSEMFCDIAITRV